MRNPYLQSSSLWFLRSHRWYCILSRPGTARKEPNFSLLAIGIVIVDLNLRTSSVWTQMRSLTNRSAALIVDVHSSADRSIDSSGRVDSNVRARAVAQPP